MFIMLVCLFACLTAFYFLLVRYRILWSFSFALFIFWGFV